MTGIIASFVDAWHALAASPAFSLALTLGAYVAARACARRMGGAPLANPVVITIVLVIVGLAVTGTPYATYRNGASFIHFLLAPATVALAVPLYRQLGRLRRLWLPLTVGLLAGSVTAIVSAVACARWLGASPRTVVSLAPKSVTTPIAMAVAESLGGNGSLAAVAVIATGIVGAIAGPALLRCVGVRRDDIGGFAIGLAAHGIGTARAFQLSTEMGAFAALAMGLNGLLTACIAPWLVPLLLHWF
ncbi:LrgB family protein [Chitinasiproducens palmae]|uniref:TIGR00659 family protein n=1 Tax=Chitinasiproducens palmae TaxID=1770053 RepID=A0A1H2PSE7_9BURK|nr:LrgB family protein [Chitinasiproducens palmae]SDV49476.1 TIGR00659 family protein [Chitinasiproducens palmae]